MSPLLLCCAPSVALSVGPAPFSEATPTVLLQPEEAIGVAWGDYDDDGDPDLYVSGGGPNRLFRNERDGHFLDVTPEAMADTQLGQGSSWADYDRDGDLDLYHVTFTGENRLYRNDGLDQFVDVTPFILRDPSQGYVPAWTDFDLDGWPDLYVVNSLMPNHLFRNTGPGGFVRRTAGPLHDDGPGNGQTWSDFDGDGDLDLFLTRFNDTNRYLLNEGGGEFVDATRPPFDDDGPSLGSDAGDFDNDGDMDLFIAQFGAEDLFLTNHGPDGFTSGQQDLLGRDRLTFGGLWGDYDLDGDLDLFVHRQGANRLLRNDGGIFVNVLDPGLGRDDVSIGAAWADYDGDGDLDIFIANYESENQLLRNDTLTAGDPNPDCQWLQVRLAGKLSDLRGIGARVEVTTASGTQVREMAQVRGYLSQQPWSLHFGLGRDPVVETLVVRWPSGIVQILHDVTVNRILTIRETGSAYSPDLFPGGQDLEAWPNPFRDILEVRFGPTSRDGEFRSRFVTIFDATGARIVGPRKVGHEWSWNGRDSRGVEVSAGAYWLQVRSRFGTDRLAVMRLR